MKKFGLGIILSILSLVNLTAQNNKGNAIMDVEFLKHKADSIAAEYLENVPMFLGYSVVLQPDQDGHLTSQTFPLDARFRYCLPEGMGVDGTGITIQIDSSLKPYVEMGSVAKGKIALSDYFISLTEAIRVFKQSYEGDEKELKTVSLFQDATMAEPVYVFSVQDGLFIIGAVSRDSMLMKK